MTEIEKIQKLKEVDSFGINEKSKNLLKRILITSNFGKEAVGILLSHKQTELRTFCVDIGPIQYTLDNINSKYNLLCQIPGSNDIKFGMIIWCEANNLPSMLCAIQKIREIHEFGWDVCIGG